MFAADAQGDVVGLGNGELEDRLLARHQQVDPVHVDERVAVRPRHVGVHLGDDEAGALGGAFTTSTETP